MIFLLIKVFLLFISPGLAQVVKPLAERCGPSDANIVCINHYSAVMPGDFFRKPINNSFEPSQDIAYENTAVSNDPSWELAANADFLVFDRGRGLELLGPTPKNEYRFTIENGLHDAPVYSPPTNELYFSRLAADYLPQLVINLTDSPPTLSAKTASPPLYSASGGWFYNGLIYYCVGGGNKSVDSSSGIVSRPGIYTLNTTSGKSEVLINNYFGYYFNSCDDIIVDVKGDVWFTDNDYAWGNRVDEYAPQLGTASYRFRPSTGAVNIIEDTLGQPNGIAFSPDGKTLYLSDSAAISLEILQNYGSLGIMDFNITSKRTVYAFDVSASGNSISNKRPIYLSKQWIPDGLKVARNGYILTGTGGGVDILDEEGTILATIKTNYTAVNVSWSGKDFETRWIIGFGGVSEISLNLPGPILT